MNYIFSLNTSHHIFRRSSTFECSPTEFANRIECSECKNLLVFKKESSICSNCICKLYSPKTCISCNGRISFQDLTQVKNLETLHGNQFNRKLCNCLARIQSPTFDSIQSKDMHSSSEITDHFLDPGAYYSLAGTSNSYFMSIDDFSDDVI